jgi:hypothetical protein
MSPQFNTEYKFLKTIFILFLMTKPLYLWASGLPQISDLILVFLFIYLLISTHWKVYFPVQEAKSWVGLLLVIISYQFLVNSIWEVVLVSKYSGTLLKSMIYYIFNLIVVIVVMMLIDQIGQEKVIECFYMGMFLSAILCLVGVLLHFSAGSRNTGFFNNPNQLGYYAILLLTIALYYRGMVSKYKRWTMIGTSIFFTIASLSKAAIIALMVILIIDAGLTLRDKASVKQIAVTLIKLTLVVGGLYIVFLSNNEFVLKNPALYKVRYRIENMSGESDSDLNSGRGYGRLEEIDVHIVEGVGEGKFDRFESLKGKESHSTYMTILVCYGIIGGVLYLFLILKALYYRGHFISHVLLFSGVFLYWMTHNGLRSTLLWVFLALLVSTKEYRLTCK